MADNSSSNGLMVYPNPAINKVNVRFNGTNDAAYTISIVDVTGRNVISLSDVSVQGLNQREIDLSAVSGGVYFLIIQSENTTQKVRLVVE